jgi:hypothetical protein
MNTKDILLQAALKVFATNGYRGSSLADSAKEVRFSKPFFTTTLIVKTIFSSLSQSKG